MLFKKKSGKQEGSKLRKDFTEVVALNMLTKQREEIFCAQVVNCIGRDRKALERRGSLNCCCTVKEPT